MEPFLSLTSLSSQRLEELLKNPVQCSPKKFCRLDQHLDREKERERGADLWQTVKKFGIAIQLFFQECNST